jgi:hypothetical protein
MTWYRNPSNELANALKLFPSGETAHLSPTQEFSTVYGARKFFTTFTMDLGETGWDGRDWIELAQDRDQWRALVNTVMTLQVP